MIRLVVTAFFVASVVPVAQQVPPPTPVPPDGSPSPYPTALDTPAPSTKRPRLAAASALLADLGSGRVLWERNADERRPIASVTKIMTGLLVVEATDPDEVVTASRNAATQTGAVLGLEAGESQPVRELLMALLLQSANDAAVALAEHVGGSVEGFVEGGPPPHPEPQRAAVAVSRRDRREDRLHIGCRVLPGGGGRAGRPGAGGRGAGRPLRAVVRRRGDAEPRLRDLGSIHPRPGHRARTPPGGRSGRPGPRGGGALAPGPAGTARRRRGPARAGAHFAAGRGRGRRRGRRSPGRRRPGAGPGRRRGHELRRPAHGAAGGRAMGGGGLGRRGRVLRRSVAGDLRRLNAPNTRQPVPSRLLSGGVQEQVTVLYTAG